MLVDGEIETVGADGAAFTTTPLKGVEVPQLFLAVTE